MPHNFKLVFNLTKLISKILITTTQLDYTNGNHTRESVNWSKPVSQTNHIKKSCNYLDNKVGQSFKQLPGPTPVPISKPAFASHIRIQIQLLIYTTKLHGILSLILNYVSSNVFRNLNSSQRLVEFRKKKSSI